MTDTLRIEYNGAVMFDGPVDKFVWGKTDFQVEVNATLPKTAEQVAAEKAAKDAERADRRRLWEQRKSRIQSVAEHAVAQIPPAAAEDATDPGDQESSPQT